MFKKWKYRYGPQTPEILAARDKIGHLDSLTKDLLRAKHNTWYLLLERNRSRNLAQELAIESSRSGKISKSYPKGRRWTQAEEDLLLALAMRDMLPTREYDILTGAYRSAVGPIHPDD